MVRIGGRGIGHRVEDNHLEPRGRTRRARQNAVSRQQADPGGVGSLSRPQGVH